MALAGFVQTEQFNGMDWGTMFAGVCVILAPMIALFSWLGTRIIQGMTSAGSLDEAADLVAEAHSLRPGLRELTVETVEALLTADRAGEALSVIEALSADDGAHGRIRLLEAKSALGIGDQERVSHLLTEGISVDNLKEGELSLDALWLAVHPDEPVPAEYDFRMSGS
jgi:hypothetical protein